MLNSVRSNLFLVPKLCYECSWSKLCNKPDLQSSTLCQCSKKFQMTLVLHVRWVDGKQCPLIATFYCVLFVWDRRIGLRVEYQGGRHSQSCQDTLPSHSYHLITFCSKLGFHKRFVISVSRALSSLFFLNGISPERGSNIKHTWHGFGVELLTFVTVSTVWHPQG